jgi:hypothetical protein
MKKSFLEQKISKIVKETLEEKSQSLTDKIKSKLSEWNPNAPVTINAQPSDMYEMEEELDEMETCEQCGSEMTENECSECGYKSMKEEMDEELRGGQKKLDVAKPKGKLTSADFKKLRSKKKDMDEEMEEGNAFTGALAKAKEDGKQEFQVDGKKYNVKESVQLTETEMIELIEKIVLEQKKAKGLAQTEKVLSADKKENDQALKAVSKKMTDYVKKGSNGEFTMEPKKFPQGNNMLKKDVNIKKYTPSKAVDEYIDAFAYPGMTNLVFDEIKPDDKKIEKHLKGDKMMGNAQVDEDGNALGNVVPSEVGEKFYQNYKDNLYGQEQMNASYKRQPQPVDSAGDSSDNRTLKSIRGKKAQNILNKLDEVKTESETILSEEFNKMKHLMDYNKKTQ